MARIRTIKPEFPISEKVGKLSRDARLCFVLLWTFVDDSGRARASSRMLASLLYPYDDDARHLMPAWLDELASFGFIRRYSVDDTEYLDIPKWLKHQKIDRPSISKIPSFDEGSRIVVEPSRVIVDDALLDLGPRSKERTSIDVPNENRFDDFWAAYPSRGGAANPKKPAHDKFEKLVRSGAAPAEIILGATNYARERRASGKDGTEFVMQATKFLNQRVWEGFQAAPPMAPRLDLGETPF